MAASVRQDEWATASPTRPVKSPRPRTRSRSVEADRTLHLAPSDRAQLQPSVPHTTGLAEMATRIMLHGARNAEAECRRILSSAEAEAAAIVQQALAERSPTNAAPGAPAEGGWLGEAPEGLRGDFFDSFAIPDEDPWGFMDDDTAGFGPARIRQAFRRPPGPRPRPAP